MKLKLTSLYLISIFKNILNNEVFTSYVEFLKTMDSETDFDEILKKYSFFINKFYENSKNQNLYEYIYNLVKVDENIISHGCGCCKKDNEDIINTAQYELSLIHNIISISYEDIKERLKNSFASMSELIDHLPKFNINGIKEFNIQEIISKYNNQGYGIFACYNAFKLNKDGEIKAIEYVDEITFNDLKNYEYQQNIIKQNTQAFLNNKTANNILLYGDRGCGKSSTVKALINEFSDYNLKVIQVFKESIIHLPELFETIRNLPLKFIIFADDLSFNEDDRDFSSAKAIIEGSLSNCPKNAIIYATSNRMHLVKESFSAREGNEVHYNDTIDETVSLSDRFGIMLTFSSLTKNEYLDIAHQIANDCCVEVNDKFDKEAMMFSMQKGIMTPRIARQFINYYISNCEVM